MDTQRHGVGTGDMNDYVKFLKSKGKRSRGDSVPASFLPDVMKGFQSHLTDWALRTGRAALLADCGLGKGLMSLVWCENVLRHGTKGRTLILAPLAVSQQFAREAVKFGLKCHVTQDGGLKKGVNVTNYERLKNYRPEDFDGVVCDESSILKNQDGKTRRGITDFLQGVNHRLLCTATPAPNDFMELGTSSEALGNMSYGQMLGMFFTNDGESTQQWRLKGHAKTRFWQWIATWARACRRPSDLGFDDSGYDLPPLNINRHVLRNTTKRRGGLLPYVARTLDKQRSVCKETLKERCGRVAELVPKDRQCIVWCHLNDESKLLSRIIPGAVEVCGSDDDRSKEKRMLGFTDGSVRVLVTKPKIAGHGMNWQNCSEVIYLPSHSHEAYYQAIRRCWRFGQVNPVNVHLVTVQELQPVMDNMIRKERQSEEMYSGIIREMNAVLADRPDESDIIPLTLPDWMR